MIRKFKFLVLLGIVLGLSGCCQINPGPSDQIGPPLNKPPESLGPRGEEEISPQKILDDLKQDTKIAFTDQGKVSFTWYTPAGEEKVVDGLGLEAQGLTTEQIAELDDFFKPYFGQYFALPSETPEGTREGTIGYEIDDHIVCLVRKQINVEDLDLWDEGDDEFDEGMEGEMDWENVMTDLEVQCGVLDIPMH